MIGQATDIKLRKNAGHNSIPLKHLIYTILWYEP